MALTCPATIPAGRSCTLLMPWRPCVVTDVTAVSAKPPSAVMVRASACSPARAVLSEPLMLNTEISSYMLQS